MRDLHTEAFKTFLSFKNRNSSLTLFIYLCACACLLLFFILLYQILKHQHLEYKSFINSKPPDWCRIVNVTHYVALVSHSRARWGSSVPVTKSYMLIYSWSAADKRSLLIEKVWNYSRFYVIWITSIMSVSGCGTNWILQWKQDQGLSPG